ncbi:hypothetical protein B0H16DRAFT_1258836, partial [Mycena metata]
LLHDYKFLTRIGHVSIDEAHNIHTAGMKLHGQPPFPPAWGALGEVRAKVPKSTAIQALSATIPTHIYKSIVNGLSLPPDVTIVKVSINRKNLIYATHVLVNGRFKMRNLDMIIPPVFHPPMHLLLLVIFHDNKVETSVASQYLNSRLPLEFQSLGICRHYHSDMSPEYLEEVYTSFAEPEGNCLILNSTQGAGEVRVQLLNLLQKCGFCPTMIEPWVLEMDLDSAPAKECDPDRPLLKAGLTKKVPTKQERTGIASIKQATSAECDHIFNAKYYGDDSAEALEFTGPWCCDSTLAHLNNSFRLDKLFLGPIFVAPIVVETKKHKAANKYRPTSERPALTKLLVDWLSTIHTASPLCFVCPPSFILDDAAMNTLSHALPSSITTANSITELLYQTPEWHGLWAV